MYRSFILLASTATLAQAAPPQVVTDIAPVHSITASVMGDLGAPVLLLDAGADPHHHQLRPSEMRALSQADLVIYLGEAMTPWIEGVVDGLAGERLELLGLAGLPMVIEDGEVVGGDAGHGDHDDHAEDKHDDHDDHADHGDNKHDDHDEHDEDKHDDHDDAEHDDHGDHAGHGHHGLDPHAWLDPLNGAAFARAIAEELGHLDPANAAVYHANAEALAARLEGFARDQAAALHDLHDLYLVTYHDAYQYFRHRFELENGETIADVEGVAPGAAHLSELRDGLTGAKAACVFGEVGVADKLLDVVDPDGVAGRGMLDPLGATQEVGPGLYEAVLRDMAGAILDCAKAG